MNDMSILLYIIAFSLIGGLLSLCLATVLLLNKRVSKRFATYAMPFAAGSLLSAVFLDLLPEGLAESGDQQTIFVWALIGILLFFMAERFIRWFHHHHQHNNSDPGIPLIIIGDTVHNVLDGIAIAAAFLVSVPVGIVTTLAVAAHEIPQEIGEFGILLAKGMRRGRVLLVNALSALVSTVAAVLTYFIGQADGLPLGAIFGLSAGFLLYIALSDIIPSIHENHNRKRLFDEQPFLLLVGAGLVGLVTVLVQTLMQP